MADFQFSVQDLMSNDTSSSIANPFFRESMKDLGGHPLNTSGSMLKNSDGSQNFDGYTGMSLTTVSTALMGTPIFDNPANIAASQNALLSGLLGASTQATKKSAVGLGVFNASIPGDVLAASGTNNDPNTKNQPGPPGPSDPGGVTPPIVPGATGPVYVLGDSITRGIDAAGLSTKLQARGFGAVTVDGSTSRSINGGGIDGNKLAPLDAIAADQAAIKTAAVIIIGLGTNPGGSIDLVAFASAIDTLVRAIKAINGTAPMFWFNLVSTSSPQYPARNAVILTEGAKAGYVVIDVQKLNIPLSPDGIHPTGAGYNTLASAIAAAPVITPTPTPGPSGGTPKANAALGQQIAAGYGWSTGIEWTDLNNLIMRESGWQNTVWNTAGSGAYGIGQALPATKYPAAGQAPPVGTSDAATQITWTYNYIKGRYGDPVAAWAHETSFGWY